MDDGDELSQFATAQLAREAFHRLAVSGSQPKARHPSLVAEASSATPATTTMTPSTSFDPAEAPLPAFLELPALPDDPGLDGFVEAAGLEGGEERADAASLSMRRSASSSGGAAAAASSSSAPAQHQHQHQPLLSLLLRAAMLPWEGASCDSAAAAAAAPAAASIDGGEEEGREEKKKEDLCSSLPARLRHTRWLASRVAAAGDLGDALSEAIEANGRLLVDLESAARRAEEEAEGGEEGRSKNKNDDGDGNDGNDGDGDNDDEARLLRSLASSLASSQPRSSGWLRVRLVSYRSATRKQQRLLGSGEKKKGRRGGLGLLFNCCSAPPATLEEVEGGGGEGEEREGEGHGGRGRTLNGEGFASDAAAAAAEPLPRSRPLRRRPAAVALVWLRESEIKSNNSSTVNSLPPPPPLLRTPPARRGATSVWEETTATTAGSAEAKEVDNGDGDEDRFVPPTKVSTRFCTPVRSSCSSDSSPPALVFRLRDALGRGRLAAAVAGGDPWIGSGELSLSEVLARAGVNGGVGGGKRAAGPVAIGVPIFREADEGGGTASSPSPSSRRRELAGVLRVVVDFVCEERLPPARSGGDGESAAAPSSSSSSSSSSPPPVLPSASV